jgi:hypothetical protein
MSGTAGSGQWTEDSLNNGVDKETAGLPLDDEAERFHGSPPPVNGVASVGRSGHDPVPHLTLAH